MLNDKELAELIGDITDPEELHYNGVLYGDYGKRKTTTALRCSQRRAILIHADRGWNVFLNHPDEFDPKSIIPIEYKGFAQVKGIVEAVLSNQEPFNDVDLIVVDTISQIQEKYLDFLLENFDYGGKFREKLTPRQGKSPKEFKEIDIVSLPDYRVVRDRMRPMIDTLVAAPIDVLFLAHVREPNAMQSSILRRPNVTEAVFNLLARDATFIGYMESKKGEYETTFKPTPMICAKSQINSLTDKTIKSVDLPRILTEWKAGN